MAGIARWLVQINVPEPNVREILARVRQVIAEHPAPEWGGQMVALSRAVVALGEHGVAYRAWICSVKSLQDRSQMVGDWQIGGCVVLAVTMADFIEAQRMDMQQALAILYAIIDSGAYSLAGGVIVVPRWSAVIPEALMPAWLEWNGIQPEVANTQDISHPEVAQ